MKGEGLTLHFHRFQQEKKDMSLFSLVDLFPTYLSVSAICEN